jgi:DNA repair protein RecO (recombination protein O)
MLLKTRGIVFRTIKYGETSVITDIFTEDKGLHSFIAGAVRTPKAKMHFNLFQPMSVLDMVTYYREDSNTLNRIKELRTDYIFQSIPFDIKKGSISLFMAEICQKVIHASDENRELFEFLVNTLVFLDTTTAPIGNVHLHFLMGLSEFMGFQPSADFESDRLLFFDLKEGNFCEIPPAHGNYMAPDDTQRMFFLLENPIELCHELKLTRQERKVMLYHFLRFYQEHIPEFGEIKTPEVLEAVLD